MDRAELSQRHRILKLHNKAHKMITALFYLVLTTATLSCALVAGLVFGFAIVVMPGIARLSDREFLLAFQHMDRIIQDNHPAFMLVWVGSIFAVIAMVILGTLILSGGHLLQMWLAAGLYLLGVQLPTARFNIPLNNALQGLELEALSESELATARAQFEAPWNRWNGLRTWGAIAAVAALLMLLLRL